MSEAKLRLKVQDGLYVQSPWRYSFTERKENVVESWTCRDCGEDFEGYRFYIDHKVNVHGQLKGTIHAKGNNKRRQHGK